MLSNDPENGGVSHRQTTSVGQRKQQQQPQAAQRLRLPSSNNKSGSKARRFPSSTTRIATLIVLIFTASFLSMCSKTSNLPIRQSDEPMLIEEPDTLLYDLVIVGAGPAGLTAALFGGRANLQILVTGSSTGQLSQASALDNFPSFGGDGQAWLDQTKRQIIQEQ
ncbi:MAG: hypothetical protein AAGJ35_14730, partial [Myxococcota bacterium]